MKPIITVLPAAFLMLQLYANFSGLSVQEQENAVHMDRIMQNFYRAPSPEKVESYLTKLSALPESFITENHLIHAVFLGEVFNSYPQYIAQWSSRKAPAGFTAVILDALLRSDTADGRKIYRKISGKSPGKLKLLSLTAIAPENCSPQIIDGCWSGFFASGKSEYLKTIVGCALLPERTYNVNLSQQAALCSLLKLYESHPEVKAYLQKHLKSVYPQTQYAFASRISETAQLELLGRKLISDRKKDENDSEKQKKSPRSDYLENNTRLKRDFFAFGKPLKFQEDFNAGLLPLVADELKRRFPQLTPEKSRALAEKVIAMQDPVLPGRKKDETGFIEFFAISKFFSTFDTRTVRQKKYFLDYALRLARKYPEHLIVAQTVFRGVTINQLITYQTEKQLKQAPLHPYLLLMLQGEYFLRKAWQHRGGGYADTVSSHGWQAFRENLNKARPFFAEAHERFPEAREAAEKLMELAVLQGNYDQMVYYFHRALLAQADYSEALRSFCWYSRPRWGGSTAQLLADAKAFFRQINTDARLAQNGIWLLQTYLTELPVIDSIRYWAGLQNYEEVKELFETLAERKKLTPAQKMFWGTAAFFAGDDETADTIIAQMDDADRKFAVDLRHGSIPQIYWLDFPALHRAFNNSGQKHKLRKALHYNSDQAFMMLKKLISETSDKADKDALIDLYIILKGDVSLLGFRWKEPAFIRLCVAREKNMPLIKEVISMGADVNMSANYYRRRPLFYAMKDEKSGDLLELFLNAGADVHGMWNKNTPLDYSLRFNFPPARIERLLQSGADPNRKYHKTFSPAHASYKNLEGMKLLVKYGAKLNEITEFGHTPLDLAEKYGAVDVANFLRSCGAKRAREVQ